MPSALVSLAGMDFLDRFEFFFDFFYLISEVFAFHLQKGFAFTSCDRSRAASLLGVAGLLAE